MNQRLASSSFQSVLYLEDLNEKKSQQRYYHPQKRSLNFSSFRKMCAPQDDAFKQEPQSIQQQQNQRHPQAAQGTNRDQSQKLDLHDVRSDVLQFRPQAVQQPRHQEQANDAITAEKELKSKLQFQSEHLEPPREHFASCPPHAYMMLFFVAAIYLVHHYALYTQLAVFYAITWSLNPFAEWPEVRYMLKIAMTRRYKEIPFLFNLMGFFYIVYKVCFMYPIETILWHLDDILFPEYNQTEINEPLFLLGQPRSGTTMFESLLSEDEDRFCSMYLYEMRCPYLTVQYTVDAIQKFDQTFCGGRIYQFALKAGWLHCLPEDGERKNMRRLRYDLPDEDDLVFFYHTMCHFLLAGLFPDVEAVRFNHRFAALPQESKTKYMTFHRKAIQKVMYRRGHGKRYLAKWVAGWNGQLEEAKSFYPDAKFVVIVRDPQESLRSWMKLQGLLAYQLSGNNVMRNHPDVREAIIQENIEWFRKEIEFCHTTAGKQLLVLRYTDIVADIPKAVSFVYHFLNQYIEKGSNFDNILQATKKKQSKHKKTPIRKEDELISPQRIDQDFPKLLEAIEFSSRSNDQ